MVKSIKNKTKNKTKKIYAIDRYKFYNIHKTTNISFNPIKSCECIQNLFGKKNVSKIQSPVDPWIKARGAKWVRCLHGGKSEFHFLPPYHLKYGKVISKEQSHQIPYKSQFFENHIGIYVPDLTDVCLRAKKHKYIYYLVKRKDGLNQLYVKIPYGIDFVEIDSVKIDLKKLLENDIIQHSFKGALELGRTLEKKYTMSKQKKNFSKKTLKTKRRKNVNSEKIYYDPLHDDSKRYVTIKDNIMYIRGKDTPNGKTWKVKGKIENNKVNLDFSSKGGPKNITGTIRDNKILFSDGNFWKHVKDNTIY